MARVKEQQTSIGYSDLQIGVTKFLREHFGSTVDLRTNKAYPDYDFIVSSKLQTGKLFFIRKISLVHGEPKYSHHSSYSTIAELLEGLMSLS